MSKPNKKSNHRAIVDKSDHEQALPCSRTRSVRKQQPNLKSIKHLNQFNKALLGWSTVGSSAQNNPIGFCQPSVRRSCSPKGELILHDSTTHLLTAASTGSGKLVNSVMPVFLTYAGSIVVLDTKGEITPIAIRRRRDFGPVVILAPFAGKSDGFNFLDIIDLESDLEIVAQFLGELCFVKMGNTSNNDSEYWSTQGKDLLAALFAITLAEPAEKRNLRQMLSRLYTDDLVYSLAVLLDTIGKKIPKMAYSSISSFLQTTDVTRSGILSTAQAALKILNSEKILEATDSSSFSLEEFRQGDKSITIILQIPPAYLESHALLIRIWIGALMKAVTSRTVIPLTKTLFLLDEAATLGHFAMLETLITLCRGFGITVWSFWQDISQIKRLYKNWETILNNCTLQFYGISNHLVANTIAEITGMPVSKVRALRPDEQLLVFNGQNIVAHKLNYLSDPLFEGLYDPNPFYTKIMATKSEAGR